MTWSTPVTTSSVVAGNAFGVQPVLLLTDVYGDVVSGKTVTLSLYTDASCSTLSPATTSGSSVVTDSNGLATFTLFKTTVAGTYYVKASGDGVYSSCSGGSGALTVTAAAAYTIAFSTYAAGTVAVGSYFTTQPVVRIVDAYGNGINAATVTLTAFTNHNCSAASAGTGDLRNAVVSTNTLGVGTFTSLYYDAVEQIYIKAVSGIYPLLLMIAPINLLF
jgi:hypothetical protein